jgi:hypothetical protein
MDREIAQELRDFAVLLRTGEFIPTPSVSRATALAARLKQLQGSLPAGDLPHDLVRAARRQLCCLTPEGRELFVVEAIQKSQQLRIELSEADVSWRDLAPLPELNQEYYERVARTLMDLAQRLVPSDPDGPVDGFRWRQNGEVLDDTMQPMPWRLVKYLFDAKDNTATFSDLSPVVGDDHEYILDQSNAKGHQTKANKYFVDHGIPLTVRIKADKIILEKI